MIDGNITSDLPTIVLIEDDANDRLLVREVLEAGEAVGLRLVEAENALDGRTLVDAATACVLIDNMLPDGYGLDLVGELRAAWPALAIIMITGTGDEEIATQALRRGADDYLPKHRMTPGNLHRAIHDAIDKHQLAAVMDRRQAQFELLSALMDTAEDLLFVVDIRREAVVMGNAATRRALGRADDDLGESPAPAANLFKAGEAAWYSLRALVARLSPARFETTVWVGNYVGRPVEISARLVNQSGRQFVIGIGRDISERKNIQADLLRHAAIDPQTELPTNSAFLLQMAALTRDTESTWMLAAVHVSVLEAITRDINPETLGDWRLRIARLLLDGATQDGGCVGVSSNKTFLLALPVANLKQARDQLDSLQAALVELMKSLPKAAQPLASRSNFGGRVAFGGLIGHPESLVGALQLERVVGLAGEAELTGSQKLVRA